MNLNDFDLIIMNPPFTRSSKRSSKYSDEERKKMQSRESFLKESLKDDLPESHEMIQNKSLPQYFFAISDKILEEGSGLLASVIPSTILTSESALNLRKFLARKFHIEMIITSHDPKDFNFSEDTRIHESLIFLRKLKPLEHPDHGYDMSTYHLLYTKFISLRKIPKNEEEMNSLLDEISKISPRDKFSELNEWGQSFNHYPWDMKKGDWSPCQFYRNDISDDIYGLEKHTHGLKPLGDLYRLGAAGSSIYKSFELTDDPDGMEVFYRRNSEIVKTLNPNPDGRVKIRREDLAISHMKSCGNVFISGKFRANTGRLFSIFSEKPRLGMAWIPILGIEIDEAKALCAFLNSTLGALFLLNRRGGSFDNFHISRGYIRNLPIPDFKIIDKNPLKEAFDFCKGKTLKPLRYMDKDPIRNHLDEACSKVFTIYTERIMSLRDILSREPTITNEMGKEMERKEGIYERSMGN